MSHFELHFLNWIGFHLIAIFVNPDQIPISKCLSISNKIEGMIKKFDAVKTTFKDTGGPCLMRISLVRISLVRISLLWFLKKFHKYLPYANFGLFISLVQFFGQNMWLMQFFGYLFHYCDLPYANFGLFISLLRTFG